MPGCGFCSILSSAQTLGGWSLLKCMFEFRFRVHYFFLALHVVCIIHAALYHMLTLTLLIYIRVRLLPGLGVCLAGCVLGAS